MELGAMLFKLTRPSLTPGISNWTKFRNIVSDKISLKLSLKTTLEIDQAVQFLTTTIQDAAMASSEYNLHPIKNSKIPAHIQSLIAEKRRARAQWQRFKYPIDKARLNYLKNKLTRAFQNHKNESYHTYIQNLSTKDSSLWKATKKLLNHKQPPPPIRNSDNTWATSDTEKANFFASHLANVFKPHDISPNQTQLTRIEQSLNSPLPMALPAKHTSPGEVIHIIKKLPTGKAPGHDLISNS